MRKAFALALSLWGATAAAAVPTPAEMKGPFPILSTPYFENGEVDYATLAEEVVYVSRCGCPGAIWCQSNDAVDLLTTEEKIRGFETCLRAAEGLDLTIALGANGTNVTEMLELAGEIERLALRYPRARLAVVSRPPDDARSQEDVESAWEALARVVRRPVIQQTFGTPETPTPSVDLLVRLAARHPSVYGYVKEEAAGYAAVERMREENARRPEMKTLFAGWGGWQWLLQLRHCGCEGLVTERPAFARLLGAVWKAKLAGDERGMVRAFAMYRLLIDQRNFPPGLRGYPLYLLQKEGVFKNTVSRQYRKVRVTEGGSFGVGREWKLEKLELTPLQKAELDLLHRDMLAFAGDADE